MVKKIIALFLSLLMLGSQVGFAVSTHFCGGEVSDRAISLLGEKVNCGMESMEDNCASMENRISEQSCCDDESEVYQLRENFNKKQSSLEIETNFLKVFLATYIQLFEEEKDEFVFTNLPAPPLIQQNTQVLFQSFLL